MLYSHTYALHRTFVRLVQSVPEKMRLEVVIGIKTGIVSAKVVGLFSNETFKMKPIQIISDPGDSSENHVESRLLGNGMYRYARISHHAATIINRNSL